METKWPLPQICRRWNKLIVVIHVRTGDPSVFFKIPLSLRIHDPHHLSLLPRLIVRKWPKRRWRWIENRRIDGRVSAGTGVDVWRWCDTTLIKLILRTLIYFLRRRIIVAFLYPSHPRVYYSTSWTDEMISEQSLVSSAVCTRSSLSFLEGEFISNKH